MPPLPATVADDDLSVTACFSVHAHAEPGVMPRVLELFTKRGLTPSAWHSVVCGTDQAKLTIDIQMRGLGRDLMDYIAACLRQLAYVEVVLASETGGISGRSDF
jgi:acetolactate synthase small subunit